MGVSAASRAAASGKPSLPPRAEEGRKGGTRIELLLPEPALHHLIDLVLADDLRQGARDRLPGPDAGTLALAARVAVGMQARQALRFLDRHQLLAGVSVHGSALHSSSRSNDADRSGSASFEPWFDGSIRPGATR